MIRNRKKLLHGGNATEHHSSDVDTENGKANEQKKHDAGKCEICVEFKKHKAKFDTARVEYQKSSEVQPGESIFAADMQRVTPLPKLKTKEHVFISRLVVFNETFSSLGQGDPDYMILWHEAIYSTYRFSHCYILV